MVRVRVAEALGRLPGVPSVRLLERAMADDDAEVRRMAAWSVERLASAGRLDAPARMAVNEEVQRAARGERDPLGRVRALAAACALDPEHAGLVLDEARRHKDPLVRGAAAQLLARALEPAAALGAVAPLAADPVPAVRARAAEALGALRTRGAVLALVERLERRARSASCCARSSSCRASRASSTAATRGRGPTGRVSCRPTGAAARRRRPRRARPTPPSAP
jgi:HEAT repeat protein